MTEVRVTIQTAHDDGTMATEVWACQTCLTPDFLQKLRDLLGPISGSTFVTDLASFNTMGEQAVEAGLILTSEEADQ